MRRMLAGVLSLALLAGAVVAAADFWEEKAFTTWSDKDVTKVLNESPWARQVSVVMPRGPRETVDGRGGGDGFGSGFPTAPPQMRLTVQWRSGLPMRQALVRNRVGLNGEVPAEILESLKAGEPKYVVMLLGVSMQFANALSNVRAQTFLERSGKPPIAAEDAGAEKVGNGLALLFLFPKADAITVADREVEFVTKIGDIQVKRKFNLREMLVRGQLEL